MEEIKYFGILFMSEGGSGRLTDGMGLRPIWAWECLGIFRRESVEVRREREECLGFQAEAATSDLELDKQLKDLWQVR